MNTYTVIDFNEEISVPIVEGKTYKVAIKKQQSVHNLFRMFNKFGSISSIITEKKFTYVSYMSPQEAITCYKALKDNPSFQATLPYPASIKKVHKSKQLMNSVDDKYYIVRKRDWASPEALDTIVDALINDRYDTLPLMINIHTLKLNTPVQILESEIPNLVSVLDLYYAQESEKIVMFDVLIINFPFNCNQNVVYQLIKDILPIQHFKVDFYNFNNPKVYFPLFCIAHFITEDVANQVITSLNRKPFYYKKLSMFSMEEIESHLALD